ncbi:hypothetical protein SAMD00023353_2500810 [Rosellinia necatrix]|uniref:Uncharacterized protein n=1 Tax=Rosellinia necatrix TaxID=77044 RepID=A0A1W2TG43_ROSNE|nr:hypothetical protein SAMD00023353_2500810 [Rosellinia necatrix]
MAPWIPRLHLFEIADQSWFPPFLRAYVQAGLTHAWTTRLPILQPCSPATLVAGILRRALGRSISSHTYVDFCAGAGGPTPDIERALNRQLAAAAAAAASQGHDHGRVNGDGDGDADGAVKFVLTDLHPHVESWAKAARASPHLTYVSAPVDAAAAPPGLVARAGGGGGRGVFRLFNLAFHHFDDHLARAILKDTVETSDGFGIFELQSRDVSSFVSCLMFGVFIFLIAPLLYWWSPQVLFFVYVVPVVPFVLVFDGFISSLRTRTADEVEVLLRTCGAEDAADWVVQSGSETFLWPCGRLTWIVCTKESVGQGKS